MKGAKCSIVAGAILFAATLSILISFRFIYKIIYEQQITLTPGTLATKMWQDAPLDIYEKLYFFNITNGDLFVQNKEPLNVTEVGPYTYKANWTKFDHYWNPNGTVSYRELKVYEFVPELSAGSQEDIIYSFNGPMLLSSAFLKKYNVPLRIFCSLIMKLVNESIIIRRSIRELVFEGYNDTLTKYAPMLQPDIPFRDGKFGWLYGRNATDEGLFTVFTGERDGSTKNIINRWMGQEKLSYWKSDSCNSFNGATNVEMGPPLPETPGTYPFFQAPLCRIYPLNYTGDEVIWGILLKRFKASYDMLANSSENPSNACYETNRQRPSGVIDVSTCQFGAPIIMSYPHFYMADPSYLQNINGLNPIEKEHETTLDVHPSSGFTLGIDMKMQINIQIEHIKGIFQFDSLPEGIYPVYWIRYQMELSEYWAHYIKSHLNNPLYICYPLLGFLLLVSVSMLVFGVVQVRVNNGDESRTVLIGERESNPQQTRVSSYGSSLENSLLISNTTVQTS